jgi:hypothetical protein
VNEREQMLVRAAIDRLRLAALPMRTSGWKAEIIVLNPSEIPRLPGYKVALVVAVDSIPSATSGEAA